MEEESRPVKMMLPKEVAFALDDIATKRKRDYGNWKIGAGTIAAEIMTRVFKHPEILESLLSETQSSRLPVAAETRETYDAAPKKASRKR